MKKTLLFTIIMTFFSQLLVAQIESWNIQGYTPPEEIEILDNLEEAKDFQKGDLIFSKAKGVFSISPINTINNRALRKLKSEASIKGASHLYINYRNIENSVFSKTSMYSATIYKENNLNISDISKSIDGKKLLLKMEKTYSRNSWKMNYNDLNEIINFNLDEPLEERNGKIFINIRNKDESFKKEKYEGVVEYEIIALEGNKLLIFKGNKSGTSNTLLGLEIQ
ncbi:hypothetical protein MM236_05435 [Belliella sp. DSM 107340]|uniref:Uncharacterized protein n=1 Tax=Belliella calami TaxID=2923436 RepID=A0ABS9UMD7_9BACT|nr:hypothetical protein [Belliella calami]MCH7397418.1 hypothetical protein [Belliella calami]